MPYLFLQHLDDVEFSELRSGSSTAAGDLGDRSMCARKAETDSIPRELCNRDRF